MDKDNHFVILHGMNVAYKRHPYHPKTDVFDYIESFNKDDILNLKKWGFNVVRLAFFWEGVEPVKGQYNL